MRNTNSDLSQKQPCGPCEGGGGRGARGPRGQRRGRRRAPALGARRVRLRAPARHRVVPHTTDRDKKNAVTIFAVRSFAVVSRQGTNIAVPTCSSICTFCSINSTLRFSLSRVAGVQISQFQHVLSFLYVLLNQHCAVFTVRGGGPDQFRLHLHVHPCVRLS